MPKKKESAEQKLSRLYSNWSLRDADAEAFRMIVRGNVSGIYSEKQIEQMEKMAKKY